MMFTMKFFDALLSRPTKTRDEDLRAFARLEYKFDEDYAFFALKTTGKIPENVK